MAKVMTVGKNMYFTWDKGLVKVSGFEFSEKSINFVIVNTEDRNLWFLWKDTFNKYGMITVEHKGNTLYVMNEMQFDKAINELFMILSIHWITPNKLDYQIRDAKACKYIGYYDNGIVYFIDHQYFGLDLIECTHKNTSSHCDLASMVCLYDREDEDFENDTEDEGYVDCINN